MLTSSLLFLETLSCPSGWLPNDEQTAWLMPIVIKVPRYAGKVLPHTVELDVKPPAHIKTRYFPRSTRQPWLAAMCNEQDVAEHAPLRVQRQQAALACRILQSMVWM